MKQGNLLQDFDERIVPDETDKGIISIHLKRYQFARPFCRDKVVLDAACGVGYGTYDLADDASQVIGIDRFSDAVSYASARYSKPNVIFRVMDACRLHFQDDSFDSVVSFETIEHLDDPTAYLKEVVRVLKSDGIYLVSAPYVQKSTNTPQNPHHRMEWSPKDFRDLLSQHFSSVTLFGQLRKQTVLHRWLQKMDVWNFHAKWKFPALTRMLSRAVGTTPVIDMDLSDMEIRENEFQNAFSVIGLCRGPKKSGITKQ